VLGHKPGLGRAFAPALVFAHEKNGKQSKGESCLFILAFPEAARIRDSLSNTHHHPPRSYLLIVSY